MITHEQAKAELEKFKVPPTRFIRRNNILEILNDIVVDFERHTARRPTHFVMNWKTKKAIADELTTDGILRFTADTSVRHNEAILGMQIEIDEKVPDGQIICARKEVKG